MEHRSENQNKPLNEETPSKISIILDNGTVRAGFTLDQIVDAIRKSLVEHNFDYDKEEDEHWMVADYENEYRDIYQAAYKATQVEDETQRFYAYEDVIMCFIHYNDLFYEPEVFLFLEGLRQPSKKDYIEKGNPPYWGVIPPDAPNRTKVLYYKAMIIDLILELAQRMANLNIEWEK